MPLLHALPFIAYLLSGLLLTRYFILDSVTNQHRTIVNLMLLIACSSHGYILFELWQHDGVFFGLTVSISFVAWVVATLLFLTSFSKPIHSLGILVYPLSAFAVIIAFLFPGTQGKLISMSIAAHAFLSIGAYALLAIAVAQSVLVSIQERFLHEQIELAKLYDLMIMVHTPHRDKKKGTIRTMDLIEEHDILPHLVVIDHNNEGTVKAVLDRGYWAAFTIYPNTKMDSHRMVEVIRHYGADRIIVDSSADWGVSDPLAVPKTAALMRNNGISDLDIELSCYKNALSAYSQNGRMNEGDWISQGFDQSQLFEGNSVLRGQIAKKSKASY